jgi:hypothetical protein
MCREFVVPVLVPTNERKKLFRCIVCVRVSTGISPQFGKSEFGAVRSLIAISDGGARSRGDFDFEEQS